MMQIDGVKQIPMTILTGFLGAGKTTLINHILKSDHGLKPAVLVNDFGKINIDADLIENIDDDGTVNLSNGCICCSIRGDLINAVVKIYSKPNPPDYIIIECSGVSNPAEVVTTFVAPALKPFLRIDGIIAMVDCGNLQSLSAQNANLARQQIALSTVIILNKVDLISANDLDELKTLIREISPDARILEAKHGQVPLEFILGVGNFDPITVHQQRQAQLVHEETHDCNHHHHHHDHDPLEHVHHDHDIFSTFSFVSDEPFNESAFRKMVQQLPTSIYRAKGIVHFKGSAERRHVLQIVGNWTTVTIGSIWNDQQPYTHLVMIGEKGKLDEIYLNELINSCLTKHIKN